MVTRILLATSSFGAADASPLQVLKAAGVALVRNPHGRTLTESETIELLSDVDGTIAGTEPLNAKVLASAPRLRAISRVGVGTETIDLAAARARQIAVHTTPDAVTDAVAELTLAGLLSLMRGLPQADVNMREGKWLRPMGSLLTGKTVGIIGLGRIGRRVSSLLLPFGVTLLGSDPAVDPQWAQANHVTLVSLHSLLSSADIVLVHASQPTNAAPLLGPTEMQLMKKGALLVNTARGSLVDEIALADALQGHLGGAYLDTFSHEPYEGPLARLSNTVLSPHLGSYAREARARMEMEAVRSILTTLGVKE